MFSLIAAASPAATAPLAAASAAAAKLPPALQQQLQNQIQQQLLQNPNVHYLAQTPLQQHAAWLTHTFAGVFIAAALALIGLLAVQTTKQEGLSGTIGGRVESSYRGRLGFEGQIARVTGFVAITFVVVATLVSLSGI